MCRTPEQVKIHGRPMLDPTAGMTDAEQAVHWKASRDRMAAQNVELGEKVDAAREFVKRHPSLTLVDLAEFEAFLRVPAALREGA